MAQQRRRRFRRRNRLSTNEWRLVAVVAAIAGIVAMFAGCEPTSTPVVDELLSAGVAAAVTWAAGTAPWWALAGGAGVLALVDPLSWRTPITVAACAVTLLIGAKRTSWAVPRAAAGAALTLVAMRLEIDEPFAASALIAAAVFGFVFVSGVARRSKRVRRRVWWSLAGLGIAAGVAVLGALVGALAARSDLERGIDAARDGLSALRDGESAQAADDLAQAAAHLRDAHGAVDAPWMWPARAVPVLSQHVKAATDLVDAAAGAADTVSTAVVGVDLDSVRVRNGQIDLTALAALNAPLQVSVEAVESLSEAVADSRSGWLVGPAADRLRDLADETDDAVTQARNARDVTELAPRLLGQDGERVWLVLFTTPAEARGLGGFPGNFAEISADAGLITVTRVGRATDLISGGSDPGNRTISGPTDYLARYGPIGAGGAGRPVDRLFWNNVTASPDLPTVASVVAELYPQSGGRAIDGVIVADPAALQGIVALTGPLAVEGRDAPITSTDTANYLLREQYQAFPEANEERKDALTAVAVQAIQALLTTELPSPAVIARALGEPSRTGHLMIWSLHPEDQATLRQLGVSGAMPLPAPDGFSYTINNAGPNKLDAYLQRTVSYDAIVDPESGKVGTTITMRLRNTVPVPVTLPPDVVGSERGLPPGTNRSWVAIYSPLRFVEASLNDVPHPLASEQELGWNVYSTYVNIPPGEEVVLTAVLGGELDLEAGYALAWRPPPLAEPTELTIRVRDVHGARLVTHSGPLEVVTVLPFLS